MTGGTITMERGAWGLATTPVVRTGDTSGLTSLSIVGDGMHNTYLFPLTGWAGDSLLDLSEPTYCKVRGIHLFNAGIVNYGISVRSGSEIDIHDVFSQNAVQDGFYFKDNFMMRLGMLRSKGAVRGFAFDGPHTSISASALYSLDNSGPGFDIQDIIYSEFMGCGSDSNREGYRIKSASGLKLTSCGAESNQRSAFALYASAAQDAISQNAKGIHMTLDNCVSFNNDWAGAGFGSSIYSEQSDTSSIELYAKGFRELSSTKGISIVAAGSVLNHYLHIDAGSNILGSIAGPAEHAVNLEPKSPFRSSVSVSTANTKVFELKSVFGNQHQYSALVNIIASSQSPVNNVASLSASYLLMITKSQGISEVKLVSSSGNTNGSTANSPSFTWSIDAANNILQATPIGSSRGTFSLQISTIGNLNASL